MWSINQDDDLLYWVNYQGPAIFHACFELSGFSYLILKSCAKVPQNTVKVPNLHLVGYWYVPLQICFKKMVNYQGVAKPNKNICISREV